MYQIDNSTAATTQPASTMQNSGGWFTDGNAASGIAPTIVPAEWLNAVQAELCNLVTKTGQTLTKNAFTQVAQAIQSGKLNYGVDSGAANAYAVTYTLPLGALFTGLTVSFQALHTNTGNSTLNVSGLGASPIYGAAHVALQGGEILADGYIEVTWNAALNGGSGAWVLLEQTGGATQVAPATQSQHAVQFGQLTGLVGSLRNGFMVLTTASSSATFSADQVVVGTALNGLEYLLASYSKTVTLTSVGAGGMDTGSAPVSGYVALYAIYNPTTGASSILATNSTTSLAPTIYAGANMPSGYTASALISVWPTNSSGLLVIGTQVDRDVSVVGAVVVTTSTPVALSTIAAVSIASVVPKNARKISGALQVSAASGAQNAQTNIFAQSSISGCSFQAAGSTNGSGQLSIQFTGFLLITPQEIWWNTGVSNGTFTNGGIVINGYSI